MDSERKKTSDTFTQHTDAIQLNETSSTQNPVNRTLKYFSIYSFIAFKIMAQNGNDSTKLKMHRLSKEKKNHIESALKRKDITKEKEKMYHFGSK